MKIRMEAKIDAKQTIGYNIQIDKNNDYEHLKTQLFVSNSIQDMWNMAVLRG